MNKKSTISIVIPNWNGLYLMKKNLQQVLTLMPNVEVIVSDDASLDGSVEWLNKNHPKIVIIESTTRHGFATNVNRGVNKAKGDIVILLNTDVAPEKGFLSPLIKHFDDPSVFAVGCLEKSHEVGGVVYRGRGVSAWRKGLFVHKRGEVDKKDTAWVSGGAGAFRKSMWKELGGMDPLFDPFYWEDIDLSYRALKAGYTLVFERNSAVGHYHDEGKIKSVFSREDIKRIAYRNQFIFIWKNLSDAKHMALHCLLAPIRLFRALLSGDLLMIHGFTLALFKLPQVMRARRTSSMLWRKTDIQITNS